MKLHLPIGLLMVVLTAMSAMADDGSNKKLFTFKKEYAKADWEKNGSDYNFKLDLGIELNGSDTSWVISFKIPRSSTSSLGSQVDSSSGMPKELKGQEGDFYFYFDPFTDGGIIYLGGFGWLANKPDLNYKVNAKDGQFSMSDQFDIVHNPDGVLSDYPGTTSAKPGFMTHGGAGKGLDNYTRGTYSNGWNTDPSITTLYANGQRFDITIEYATPLTQNEEVYTLAGAGELGEYKAGGKGTGLLSTYGDDTDDKSVLNEDKGGLVDSLYGSESDGTKKLRFVGGGQKTQAGAGDSEETGYKDITTGEGGEVTTSSNLKMAGIIVEEGATKYTLSSEDTITWHADAEFEVNENFGIKASSFAWSGAVTMEVAEGKTLTMKGSGSGNGGVTITGGGTVAVSDSTTLGTGEINISLGSTLDVSSTSFSNNIIINGAGNLANARGKIEGDVILADIYANIDLGGLGAERIKSVSADVDAGGGTPSPPVPAAFHVTNIGSGTLNLSESAKTGNFGLDATFFSRSASARDIHYMFEFGTSGEENAVNLGEGMTFILQDSVLLNCEGTVYFWFTNGQLGGIEGSSPEEMTDWLKKHFKFTVQGAGDGFAQFFVEGSEDDKKHGRIKMLITNNSIWFASKHGEGSDLLNRTDLIEEDNWKQIVINEDTTIDIAKDKDDTLLLKNLRSSNDEGSGKLTIENTGDDSKTVELKEEGEEESGVWLFANDIELKGNTSLKKTGNDNLVITGNLTIGNGDLTVSAGTLTLAGEQSTAKSLELEENATLEMAYGGTLTLEGEEEGEEISLEQGHLEGQGTIELKNTTMSVKDGVIGSEDPEKNKLVIRTNGDKSGFKTEGAVSLAGIEGTLNEGGENGGTISLGGDLTITGDGALHSFEGKLESESGAKIIVQGDKTGQTITSAGNEEIDLEISDGAYMELYGAGDIGSDTLLKKATYKSLTVGGEKKDDRTSSPGTLYVGPTGVGADVEVGTQLNIGAEGVKFNDGSYTLFAYNFAGADDKLQTKDVGALLTSEGSITIDKGARFALSNTGSMFNIRDNESLDKFVIMKGDSVSYNGDGTDLTGLFDIRGAFLVYYKNVKVEILDGNQVVISADVNRENIFAAPTEGANNSSAGADLIWAARYCDIAVNTNSELYKAMSGIANTLASNPREASKALAAVAGSTVPIMGTAQRDALRNQLTRMRDHTGLMGLREDYTYTEMPYMHFWVEANGDFNKLDDGDGYESGYSYNAWGGTLGLEMDMDETTSVAAGITALYGTIDGGNADRADGNLDSYYLSVMGRFHGKRWGHTVVGVVGLNEAKLSRSVTYPGGSYTTHGSTNGYSAGLMYEATYDIAMNAEKTSVVQPLVNFSVMKTTLKGYDETGQDGQGVGLNVGDQDWVTATIGLGARWIGVVGESGFNRPAQLEVRANIAQDLGDSQGEASVALQANPTLSRTVRAAEVGKTALQLGASLRVPLNEQTLLYFNVDADLRDAMTSWNLGAGVRYDF